MINNTLSYKAWKSSCCLNNSWQERNGDSENTKKMFTYSLFSCSIVLVYSDGYLLWKINLFDVYLQHFYLVQRVGQLAEKYLNTSDNANRIDIFPIKQIHQHVTLAV